MNGHRNAEISIVEVSEPEPLRDLARWFASQLHALPDYISHSEILWGRAAAPDRWHEDLAVIIEREFAATGAATRRFAVRDEEGWAGLACLNIQREDGRTVATLEDLIVDKGRRRTGIATALLRHVEAAGRDAGADWLALESGLRNEGAHAFFERHGYQTVSRVMVKKA